MALASWTTAIVAAPPPTITPLPTPAPELRARQLASTLTGIDDITGISGYGDYSCYLSAVDGTCITQWDTACRTYDASLSISLHMTGAAGSSCYCSAGAQFFTCMSNSMVSAGCTTDYFNPNGADFWSAAYYWELDYCTSVPADIASRTHAGGSDNNNNPTPRTAHITTTTTITLVTVSVVTYSPATPIQPVTHTSLPTFSGSGTLLAAKCAGTSYTLLNDTQTAFFVPFVGCDGQRPECCPFTANNVLIGGATSGGTVTLTAEGTATPTQSQLTVGASSLGYPVPLASDQHATLARCPDDYDDFNTACCPKGYAPFTRAVAGQTPCYSSLSRFGTAAVTMTAGVDYPATIPAGQHSTDSAASGASTLSTSTTPAGPSFPTSAVVNVVWAMQYPKTPSSSSLSAGAIAGIAVGSVAGVGAIVLIVVYFLWRRKKRSTNPGAVPPPAQGNGMNPNLPAPQMQQLLPPPMQGQPGQPGQPMYYVGPQPPQPQVYYHAPGQEPSKEQGFITQTQQSPSPPSSTAPTAHWSTGSPWTVSTPSQGQPQFTTPPYGGSPPPQAAAEADAVASERHELGSVQGPRRHET